jgi:hypothetical protein
LAGPESTSVVGPAVVSQALACLRMSATTQVMAAMLDWLRTSRHRDAGAAPPGDYDQPMRVATRTPVSPNSSEQAGDEGPDRR